MRRKAVARTVIARIPDPGCQNVPTFARGLKVEARTMFSRKRKKTMADDSKRPGTADVTPDNEALMNELKAESEAASEHALSDSEPELPEEIETIKAELEVQKTEAVLPVLDDFERAVAANEKIDEPKTLKEGFGLIQQKLQRLLTSMGVKPMEAKGQPFDPELHEAVTKAPAPSADMKGRVIDVIENGYVMNEKVIRYAKVIVGE
jgi:molecular chaperone GrpE